MIKGLMLLMLAALLFQACADTNSSYRSRNPFIDEARLLCDLRRLRPG